MADGTIISNGQGQYKILKGGQWVDYTGPPPGGSQRGLTGSSGKLSNQDQIFLNKLSEDAMKANETSRIYDRAANAVQKLGTGPYRGEFLKMSTPEDNGGVMDKIGSVLIGGPARLSGAISPKDTEHYQYLRSLQQTNVLEGQTRQKGVQTEGDAARIMLSELSPDKLPEVNMQIIANGKQKALRAQAKAQFYNKWASQFGLHGTNAGGSTADAWWAKNGDAYTAQMFGDKPTPDGSGSGKITVLSREKVK